MKIYLDVTETLAYGLQTGIQRVVRNIAGRAVSKSGQDKFTATPVIAIGSRFFAIDHFPNESGHSVRRLGRLRANEVTRQRVFSTIKKTIKSIPVVNDLGRWLINHYRLPPFRRSFFDSVSGHWIKYRPVKPNPGDVVVLLDSFWSRESALRAAEIVHRRGIRTILVVYDLIPLTHPQFCVKEHVSAFSTALDRALRIADAAISISQDVAEQVRQYASSRSNGRSSTIPVSSFYLGADFSASRPYGAGRANKRWPEKLWNGDPVFLMVGTIEPRKGHALVLDAFERRWTSGARDKLLILGEADMRFGGLIDRVLLSPHRGVNIFMINNADDDLVREAFQRSHACILASIAEGFGLPLVEALKMGLPVLASDIPVFHEIGKDYPLYFSLDDPNSLIQAIDKLQSNYQAIREKIRGFRWLTWDEAAEMFFSKVAELSSSPGTNRKGPDNLQRTFEQNS